MGRFDRSEILARQSNTGLGHLLDVTVIALWSGHEDVQTTHVYLQADLGNQNPYRCPMETAEIE